MNAIHFNLADPDSVERLGPYARFGKLSGLLAAHRFGLPVSREGFVVGSASADLSILTGDPRYGVVLCRPDAPLGQGNRLPRGRDLTPSEIPAFLDYVRQCCSEAVILALVHPTIDLCGQYLPRYRTRAAATLLLEPPERLVIEWVGPGFDVGDITRGKTVHGGLEVSWEDRFEKPARLVLNSRLIYRSYREIACREYLVSREARISELLSELGEHDREEIERAIPVAPPRLTLDLLQAICVTCRDPVVFRLPPETACTTHGEPLMVLLNAYMGGVHVFETWGLRRSLPSRIANEGLAAIPTRRYSGSLGRMNGT